MWFMAETLGHTVPAQSPEGLEAEVSYVGRWPCLQKGTPIETLNTKFQVSSPCWQYSVIIISVHHWKELIMSMISRGEDNRELHI